MNYRELGNTGLAVSEIGLGGEWLTGLATEQVDRVIDAALADGTAEEEGDAMLEETAELTEESTEEDERGCRQPDIKQANASTAIQAGIKRMKTTPHQTERNLS